MTKLIVHDFGIVGDADDFFELHWESKKEGQCLLEEIVQTERGPRRNQIATIPSTLWGLICDRVVRELTEGMGETERSKKAPILKAGKNRLSTLIGRELAILLWALMESSSEKNTESILHGWRELAREERWWFFSKAASPGQRKGTGWRMALFYALSEMPANLTNANTIATKKKSPGNGLTIAPEATSKKKTLKKSKPPGRKQPKKLKPTAKARKKKQPPKNRAATRPKKVTKVQAVRKAKKTTKKAVQPS